MPLLTFPSRRAFLAAGAGTLVSRLASAAPEQVRWALLSDTHIPEDPNNTYRGFKPQANLTQVAPKVAAMKPDGVLIDGDLARLEGLPGDYAALKKLLAPVEASTPMCLALGNHDHRKNFVAAFQGPAGAQTIKDKHVQVIESGPVRIIGLDSLMMPNFTPGHLGRAQREWLSEYLRTARPMPTLLFVHHVPDDADGNLLDSDRLLRMISAQPAVKALIFGHSHRYSYAKQDGIHLINLPAVGYNFSDDQPVGWVEATLTARGAALQLHAIGGNMAGDGKTTEVTWR